jgi:hypothetical protein
MFAYTHVRSFQIVLAPLANIARPRFVEPLQARHPSCDLLVIERKNLEAGPHHEVLYAPVTCVGRARVTV